MKTVEPGQQIVLRTNDAYNGAYAVVERIWSSGDVSVTVTGEDDPICIRPTKIDGIETHTCEQCGAVVTALDGHAETTQEYAWDGSDEEGSAAIERLRRTGNPDLQTARRDSYIKLNDELVSVFPGVPFQNVFEMKDWGYIARPLEAEDWQKIVDQYKRTPNPYNIAYMEVYGAAIGHPAEPNAFIHRDVYMDFYIDSFWKPGSRFTDEKTSRKWIDDFMTVLAPYVNGHKYQNYPVRNLADYRWAYWGDAFNSLVFVKQKYDPTNFFRFEQSISPYGKERGITRSTQPSMFSDEEIAGDVS